MYVFWYSLLFACELCFLVTLVEPLRQLCPWNLQFLFFMWWVRWVLAVQVLNPDFYWSAWRGVLFWTLQCLSSFIYIEEKALFFKLCYLCGTIASACFAYPYDMETPKATCRDALFLVFLAINLLFCVLISALVDLHHSVNVWIRSTQGELSGTVRQVVPFILPMLHAGAWLTWGILLQAGRTREAFLMYFGCTAAQLGTLTLQIKEKRLKREIELELVEINTYRG